MNVTMIVLRIIHIGAGVFWAGAVFVNEGFLLPTMKATGPGGAPFMRHLMGVKKYPVRIATSGVLVILSGLGMPQGRREFAHAPAVEAPPVKLGANVRHPTFGIGVVTDYEGSGAHARVQVNFDGAGSKWLVLAYANLQPA